MSRSMRRQDTHIPHARQSRLGENPALRNINFKELETRGFVHIPGFLGEKDAEEFLSDFHAPTAGARGFYSYQQGSARANARAAQLADEVLQLVRQQTGLQVDTPQQVWYFRTGKTNGGTGGWHQDTESLWQTQNHYDYLNFYIPVMKERLEKSNLTVIPFDVMERECPRTYRRTLRNGGTFFVWIRGKCVGYSYETGAMHIVRGGLERMAQTPLLATGDLLLLRGDVVHKTQDTDSERIAMSFRVSSSRTIVKRSEMARGGLNKLRIMAKHAGPYHKMLLAFDAAGRDEVALGELVKLMEKITVQPPDSWEFSKQLLREKRRAGTLTQFVTATGLSVFRRMLNWKG